MHTIPMWLKQFFLLIGGIGVDTIALAGCIRLFVWYNKGKVRKND